MPAAHASIGGSNIQRIMLCPGSARLSATVPRTSSRAAARGTMLHGAMVEIIERGATAAQLLGVRYAMEGFVLEEADARVAVPKALHAFATFTRGAERVELERKVVYRRNVWGTADVIGETQTHNLVGDFKFGAHAVPAEDSPQMLFYVGAAITDGTLRMQKTRMAIIQPGKRTLNTAYATVRQIKAFNADVERTARQAFRKNAPIIPGEVQCEWCPARDRCPARGPGLLRSALKGVDFGHNRV